MKCVLLRVGKGRCAWADTATKDFTRRFQRTLPWEEIRLKPEPERGDIDRVKVAEGERVLARVQRGDLLVVLDERGESLTTDDFEALFAGALRDGRSRVVFAIGGPHGHGDAVRQQAARVIALSPMVLNHELARVILVEQIYRVSTMMWGGGYHHV